MRTKRFIFPVAVAAILLGASLPALAQTQGTQLHHTKKAGTSDAPVAPVPGAMQGAPQRMMPGGAQMPMMDSDATGGGMMDCQMMLQMMRMHPEMMSMMHGGRGYRGGMMMGQGAGSGMMMGQGRGPGMMMGPGAMGLGSGIVAPVQHLSTDDVRHHFEHRLKLLGNDRLKVGEVTQKDEDTINVEIVTLDDSLVDRFEVDRHSGKVDRLK
jgi:hypothetical protein